jgi:hypothetical protein
MLYSQIFQDSKLIDEGHETKNQTSGVEEIPTPVSVLGSLIHNLRCNPHGGFVTNAVRVSRFNSGINSGILQYQY